MTSDLSNQQQQIKALEDQIEDLTNRNMRNSIIIRGIAEDDKNETWETTKTKVAEFFQSLHNEDTNTTKLRIERAHRGGNSKNNQPRTIFARLYCSEDVKMYHELTRKENVSNRNYPYKVDFHYSEKVNVRRNEALKKRRELLIDKTITAGYVNFPAKLMVKLKGSTGYTYYQEF